MPSSQAQQDLLRVFNAFAEGGDGRKPAQVVYVTHSPFLIDRNHGERIRVLEKGVGDEGTRVVNRGSRNHYEPLRSSFGAFFAETASIGNCNLIVEGPGDQILLAAGAHFLRGRDTPEVENLDLNRLTIVPAGGAPNVPYTVYLAHGRGPEHPAVVVLLDSDKSGDQARKSLARAPVRGKRLLADQFVFQVGELGPASGVKTERGGPPVEIEDLVPLTLCVTATRRYAAEFWGLPSEQVGQITPEIVRQHLTGERSVFDALESATLALFGDDHRMDKVGFARLIAELLSERGLPAGVNSEQAQAEFAAGREEFATNVRALFRELGSRQRAAERELTVERVSGKVERIKASFLLDHPASATREQAWLMLKEVRDALDPSQEGDLARTLLDGLGSV